jgi:hypothetical protein
METSTDPCKSGFTSIARPGWARLCLSHSIVVAFGEVLTAVRPAALLPVAALATAVISDRSSRLLQLQDDLEKIAIEHLAPVLQPALLSKRCLKGLDLLHRLPASRRHCGTSPTFFHHGWSCISVARYGRHVGPDVRSVMRRRSTLLCGTLLRSRSGQLPACRLPFDKLRRRAARPVGRRPRGPQGCWCPGGWPRGRSRMAHSPAA